jgi:DNA-binding response OmpR family regulator
MTILLIDKDRNQHERFREIIRRINTSHNCLKAFSIEAALFSLEESDQVLLPDIIFLDLEFRAGGGKQFLRELKESSTLKKIPVCIYAEEPSDDDRDETHTLGAIGFVTKEANLTSMLASVRSIIESVGLR